MKYSIPEIFGPEGLFSQAFSGYEERTSQIKTVEAIQKAIESDSILLADCPTGLGKTVAYLVPAIQAVESGKRTLVVTAGIALQEQLIKKDLPTLKKVLDTDFRFALAKGINNYVCLREYNSNSSKVHLPSEQANEEWAKVCEWIDKTATGDFSELDFEMLPMVKHLISTSADECGGRECPSFNGCFAMQARQSWRDSDIVVTNYHLFFLDLMIRDLKADGTGILPDYDILVMDEAHAAAKIAREFYGFTLTSRWVMSLAKTCPRDEIRDDLEDLTRAFFAELEAHKKSPRYKSRIQIKNCAKSGRQLASLLQDAATAYDQEADVAQSNNWKVKLRSKANSCRKASENILQTMEFDKGTSVFFINTDFDKVSLESRQVNIAKILHPSIFSRGIPIILTSATLANGKDDFSLIKRDLGILKAEQLCVDSPFDFSKSCVIIPEMCDPKNAEFQNDVGKVVEISARMAKGRTLALFTSWKGLEACYQRLMKLHLPWPILKQGSAPKMQLIERFKNEDAILLGVSSFWAGIDVPGDRLSCLVIDKIPFASPDDPIMSFLQDMDDAAFNKVSVPNAIIEIKQGIGRLIRNNTDRGAIVLCDPRILKNKTYGPKFLYALPKGIRFGRNLEMIKEYVNGTD